MKNLVMGLSLAALVVLTVKTEARPPASFESTRVAGQNGMTLVPLPLGRPQSGWASWYGAEFQGIPTASGEPYDMNRLTAAHRSLPLGSTILVTNLRNHRSLLLEVNDRGPNIGGRLLDVSRAAARRLGFAAAGLARVRVRTVSLPAANSALGTPPRAPGSCMVALLR
ncbi:MAG TPA: septal ring lytic transglycosylase RlpA family protein [Terriglobia bacterium]|nr:septal ring lytic transglycosylase RlpA family protein [Terriglobia bacterium]